MIEKLIKIKKKSIKESLVLIKIAILGAAGKVGEAVYKILSRELEAVFVLITTETKYILEDIKDELVHIDVTNKSTLKETLYNYNPEIIINCVAYTDVDGCETEKKKAWELNTTLVENLMNISKVLNSHFITFSTDFIFNGQKGPYCETDKPDPLNYYGKSKLAAENLVIGNYNKYTIFRTNMVYGYSSYGKGDFMRWVIGNLQQGKEIFVVDSLFANPTLSDDIAEAVLFSILKKKYGIYNVSGTTYTDRLSIAKEVARVFDLDENLIHKTDIKELKQKAIRPQNGGLVVLKAITELGIHPSTLESGLINLKLQLNKE